THGPHFHFNVTSCVQKLTFILLGPDHGGIFAPVSNPCPQGPPIQGILPPQEQGPKVHLNL
ncbi:MAG TPA: hypothetical protein VJT50_05320, partial [Pyrinomonadaceae bacterium]|nr:hypothetical protein [Pyrinomonadaceae bacterium]